MSASDDPDILAAGRIGGQPDAGPVADDEDDPSPRISARRRRPLLTAAATALAVVASAVWLARNAPTDPAAERSPAPPSAAATSAARLPTLTHELAVRFADADRGYALSGRCESGDRACSYLLGATADGGRSWQQRRTPLPRVTPAAGFSADLLVLGPHSLLLEHQGWRHFSPDGGVSWRLAPAPGTAKLEMVPAGWRTIGACPYAYENTDGCRDVLAALDPRSGQRSPLEHQPRLRAALGTERPPEPSDGSLWIPGVTPDGRAPAVAVSRDRGRTWTTVELDRPGTTLLGVSLLTHDGRTGYAFVRALPPLGTNARNGLAAIWRTTDGGARWSRVASRGAPSTALGVALLPGGRLLLTAEIPDGTNLWESDDGGRTFRQRAAGPALGWIEQAGERWVAGSIHGGYYTSTDGAAWTAL